LPPQSLSQNQTKNLPSDGVLAYFLTFRCYGTWFHGETKGSMDRRYRNEWREQTIEPSENLERREYRQMKGVPILLHKSARKVVSETIHEVCQFKKWNLIAINVLREHVHLVVSSDEEPDRILNILKSWCTRRLRENDLMPKGKKVWSRHGSTVWLWTEDDVSKACNYLELGQAWPPGT
jgi:REP element-mobilizing transposase RayT